MPKIHFNYILAGFSDALKALPYSFLLLYKSNTLRSLFFKCFLVNGVLFLGSMFFWDWLIRPLLIWWIGFFITSTSDTTSSTMGSNVNDYIHFTDSVATTLYYMLWIWPVYGLSFLLNSIWYQDIADCTFKIQTEILRRRRSSSSLKQSPQSRQYHGLASVISDEIYRTLMITFYLMETIVFYHLVPVIGPLISFILLCWLYSYYSFEYNWMNRGWKLEQRLWYFEKRWEYFAGFGLPSALLTFWFPQLIGGGVFALIFPTVRRNLIGRWRIIKPDLESNL